MSTAWAQEQLWLAKAFRRWDSIGDDKQLASICSEIVSGNDRLTPVEQADIYRGQYFMRHHDVLYDDYPGLVFLLGEDRFQQFCRDYLDTHPPASFTLRDLGEHVVPFAETYNGFKLEERTLFVDMARYEHAFIDIFDGPDAEKLDPKELAGLSPEALATKTLVLRADLLLIELSYPVYKIRTALRRDKEPTIPTEPGSYRLAMYRDEELKVHYLQVPDAAFQLLVALRGGASLEMACEQVGQGLSDEAMTALGQELARSLKTWGERAWISAFRDPVNKH